MAKKKSSTEGKAKAVRSIAQKGFVGPHPGAKYIKYGDLNPSDVHEGTATYRGIGAPDSENTSVDTYANMVKRGHGKRHFLFQGELYKVVTKRGQNTAEKMII